MVHDELLEHFKYPCNKKSISNPDFCASSENPSCGDKISIEGTVLDGKIVDDIGFCGSGCVISQATTSMLTEFCKGKSIDSLLDLKRDDILSLIKMELGPNRLKCALLCLQVLHQALLDFKNGKEIK